MSVKSGPHHTASETQTVRLDSSTGGLKTRRKRADRSSTSNAEKPLVGKRRDAQHTRCQNRHPRGKTAQPPDHTRCQNRHKRGEKQRNTPAHTRCQNRHTRGEKQRNTPAHTRCQNRHTRGEKQRNTPAHTRCQNRHTRGEKQRTTHLHTHAVKPPHMRRKTAQTHLHTHAVKTATHAEKNSATHLHTRCKTAQTRRKTAHNTPAHTRCKTAKRAEKTAATQLLGKRAERSQNIVAMSKQHVARSSSPNCPAFKPLPTNTQHTDVVLTDIAVEYRAHAAPPSASVVAHSQGIATGKQSAAVGSPLEAQKLFCSKRAKAIQYFQAPHDSPTEAILPYNPRCIKHVRTPQRCTAVTVSVSNFMKTQPNRAEPPWRF